MAILYAFDEHKNRIIFNGDTDIPLTVPMRLPDGSILFYDRGTSYGEYKINNSGYPVRNDGAVDDETAESANWRYLICDQADLDNAQKHWGPMNTSEGLYDSANYDVGGGLPNTEAMISKYSDDDTYWWKFIKEKRDGTGLKWFMPSIDELDLIYKNMTAIIAQGGDIFQPTSYWSSTEGSLQYAWAQWFANGNQDYNAKTYAYPCRLLRRI